MWRWLPRTPRAESDVVTSLRDAGRVLGAPGPRRWTALGALVFLLLFGLVLTVLPVQLAALGLGPGARGLVLALPVLTSTLAGLGLGLGLGLGRLSARFGVHQLVVASFGLWAVAFGLIAAVPGLPAVAAGLLLYGMGEGLVIPVLQNAVAGVAPAGIRGTVVAVFVGATRAGQTTGPVLVGPLLDDPRVAFAAGAVVAVLAAAWPRARARAQQSASPASASAR